MRILILGYSRIAKKRIIPAIEQIEDFTAIDVASRSSASSVILPERLKGKVFDDYQEALSISKADLVYISTTNDLHAELIRRAIIEGFHVIVDKPAFLTFEAAQTMVRLAGQHKRCLAEATVYAYHPQIDNFRQLFVSQNDSPIRLIAALSFPPLNPDNYRYREALGGGAIYDLGPYAVSPGRLFFKQPPQEIYCRVNTRCGKDNLDASFTILAIYGQGKSLVGHFGFDTAYANYITALSPNCSVSIEHIFTIPADMENEIKIRQEKETRTLKVTAADCFAIFMKKVLAAIKEGDYQRFKDDILYDALSLERMRQAALKG